MGNSWYPDHMFIQKKQVTAQTNALNPPSRQLLKHFEGLELSDSNGDINLLPYLNSIEVTDRELFSSGNQIFRESFPTLDSAQRASSRFTFLGALVAPFVAMNTSIQPELWALAGVVYIGISAVATIPFLFSKELYAVTDEFLLNEREDNLEFAAKHLNQTPDSIKGGSHQVYLKRTKPFINLRILIPGKRKDFCVSSVYYPIADVVVSSRLSFSPILRKEQIEYRVVDGKRAQSNRIIDQIEQGMS